MTCCRIPEFCERYKIDIGIYNFKSIRILPRTVKERNICLYIHKSHFCVIWKKNSIDSSLIGIGEIERNFKHIENKINGNNKNQRIGYRFPKNETIDQPENVFVFDLET